MTLEQIAEKVEALDAPNYAIEAEISEAIWLVKWGKRKPKDIRVPNYTASLDAAMSLVPEGALWAVANCGIECKEPEFSKASAACGHPDQPTEPVEASTPALALCAAALRARAAQEKQ